MAKTALKAKPEVSSDEDLHKRWQRENGCNVTPVLRPELVVAPKHKPSYIGSMYLSKLTRTKNLRERIQLAVRALKEWDQHFDAVAFSGMSGALIAPGVALRMNKEMIMVRKPAALSNRRDSHSDHWVEGDIAARSYIIVDDFIDSGKTRDYIRRKISEVGCDANFVGVLQVNHLDSMTLDDFERRGTPYPLAQ
jgi:adenine/guanine phosphoribosyltransferase-like PRPP-binding protein